MNTEVDDEIWHGDWLVEYTTSALDGDHHHLTIVHGQTVASAHKPLCSRRSNACTRTKERSRCPRSAWSESRLVSNHSMSRGIWPLSGSGGLISKMIRSGASRDERSYGVRHPEPVTSTGTPSSVGIDDLAIHVPRLYLDMRDFAALRAADYDKLNKGLGLSAMAIPDVHEDTATMGAMAVMRLIDRNGLNHRDIGRLYLGTESALDGAKPTATYIVEMLTQRYASRFGEDCFQNCDVVDMPSHASGLSMPCTRHWIGAPEAARRTSVGIVVYSDNAKYELGSLGVHPRRRWWRPPDPSEPSAPHHPGLLGHLDESCA